MCTGGRQFDPGSSHIFASLYHISEYVVSTIFSPCLREYGQLIYCFSAIPATLNPISSLWRQLFDARPVELDVIVPFYLTTTTRYLHTTFLVPRLVRADVE